MERRRSTDGFTLLELMIAIGLTLFVVGTYLRFFSHTARYEANNTLKTSAMLKGEYIADTLENAIRLIGLSNTSLDFRTGTIVASANGAAVSVTDGGYLSDMVIFDFVSPWGGPVTSTKGTPLGTAPNCTLFPANLNSILGGNQSFNIITKDGKYAATASIDPNDQGQIPLLSLTPSASGSCDALFPAEGTIITGPNRQYSLRYVNGTFSLSYTIPPDTTTFFVFSYPQEEIPFLTLQFLTETVAGNGTITRTWTDNITDCSWGTYPTDPPYPACSTIKAVRFGFVVTAKGERVGSSGTNAFNYCFFQDGANNNVCYSASPNTGKRYAAFSRVVHLRNYDYLKQHLLE